MNDILLEFAGRMADAGATQLPESFEQLCVNADFHLKTRQPSTELGSRLKEVTEFRLNTKKGRITFVFEDQTEISTDAQVVGTYSDDGSWMWGWGHPEVPVKMQQAAWAVQQFGERQEIENLLTRGGPTEQGLLEKYQAICAYISNADGVFMGEHGGAGQVCVAYYLQDQLKGLLGE